MSKRNFSLIKNRCLAYTHSFFQITPSFFYHTCSSRIRCRNGLSLTPLAPSDCTWSFRCQVLLPVLLASLFSACFLPKISASDQFAAHFLHLRWEVLSGHLRDSIMAQGHFYHHHCRADPGPAKQPQIHPLQHPRALPWADSPISYHTTLQVHCFIQTFVSSQ